MSVNTQRTILLANQKQYVQQCKAKHILAGAPTRWVWKAGFAFYLGSGFRSHPKAFTKPKRRNSHRKGRRASWNCQGLFDVQQHLIPVLFDHQKNYVLISWGDASPKNTTQMHAETCVHTIISELCTWYAIGLNCCCDHKSEQKCIKWAAATRAVTGWRQHRYVIIFHM